MSDTDADLTALIADVRLNAEAATSPVWHAWDRSIGWEVHVGAEHIERDWGAGIFCTDLNSGFRETFAAEDAKHIARMDPATTLRLVDAVERLTRERDDARAENERLRREYTPCDLDLLSRAEAAEAEVADLRTRLATEENQP